MAVRQCCSNSLFESNPAFKEIRELEVGTFVSGYILEKKLQVDEMNLIVAKFRHKKTDAIHVHIYADDTDNAFSVTFKTPVHNNTGVSHILEHMVLSGSKKYPVRDAFFQMNSRSVSTFMNAMTFYDHTTYPFSSTNKTDFLNLLSVYLDSVFNPLLKKSTFEQEGWSFRFDSEVDSNLKPKLNNSRFDGVVFNEMKGAMNSQSSMHDLYFLNGILPKTYPYNSGGNPLDIVTLSYEDLLEFHRKYYHPSNSLFVTYGDFGALEHLAFINENYLSKYERSSSLILPSEPSWNDKTNISKLVPVDNLMADSNKQCILTIGYKIPILNENYYQEIFIARFLSSLLYSGPNSVFHKELITKNIGSEFCSCTGLNTYTKDCIFGIGLKGLREDQLDNVSSLIQDTFLKITDKNDIDVFLSQAQIETTIKETELYIKHIKAENGINHATVLPTFWAHGYNDILDAFPVQKHLDYIKERYKDGFFENLIKEYFVDNKHILSLRCIPDANYLEKIKSDESLLVAKYSEKYLKENSAKVDDSSSESILNNENLLPTIHLSDLPKNNKEYDAEILSLENSVYLHSTQQPTNGITYIKFLFDTRGIPADLATYLPIFTHIITKIGAGDYDHKEMDQRISSISNGFNSGIISSISNMDVDQFYSQGILFSSYCLNENFEKMLEIWIDIFTCPKIDKSTHMKSLLNEYIISTLSGLGDIGHKLALQQCQSRLCSTAKELNLFFGLPHIDLVMEIDKKQKELQEKNPNTDIIVPSFIDSIINIVSLILDQSRIKVFLSTSPDFYSPAICIIEDFVNRIPNMNTSGDIESNNYLIYSSKFIKEYINMHSQVNYNVKSYRAVHFSHPDYAKLSLAATILSHKFLLPEIREKGGAYGAGAQLSSGCFNFYSYRDPNIDQTYKKYSEAVEWLLSGKFTDVDIEEAKIKKIGNMDHPVTPGNRTSDLFLNNISNTMKQDFRDAIFNISRADILSASKNLFDNNQYQIVSVGGQKEIIINTDWEINLTYSSKNSNDE